MAEVKTFEDAAEKVKTLKSEPTNDEMLTTYAFYKQVTVGDCNTSRPGMFDMKGKAKWDAWNGKKGVSKEEAEKSYVEHVNNLIAKYGLQ